MLLASIVALPARAELITFEVTGVVTAIEDPLGAVPDLEQGDAYSLMYSFDSTTTDIELTESVGIYPQETTGLIAMVGATDFFCISPDTYEIQVINAPGTVVGDNEEDEYVVAASGCGPFGSDATLELMQLSLIDSGQQALPGQDDDLLLVPPDLSDWDLDISNVLIAGCPDTNPSCSPAGDGFSIAGSVDDIVLAPEPALAALQGTALLAVGLAALSRRRPADLAPSRKRPSA